MTESTVPVITVDGPGGAGKGMLSQALAAHLRWHRLESGVLYRCLALLSLERGITETDTADLQQLAGNLQLRFEHDQIWQGERQVTALLRAAEVEERASIVARVPQARRELLNYQLSCRRSPGLIAEGRDMGTVVFPDAPLKIFLSASVEERARRRLEQLKATGRNVKIADLMEQIRQRDERDSQRKVSPLIPATDAVSLDTTDLSPQQVIERSLALWRQYYSNNE